MSLLSLVLNRASRRIPIGIILVLVGAALLGWLGSLYGTLPVWVARPLDVLSAFTTVFLVSRFAVTCCVADALAIGMIVSWPQAVSFSGNTWVRVCGRLETASIANQTLSGIKAQFVDPIPEPDQPYLFP